MPSSGGQYFLGVAADDCSFPATLELFEIWLQLNSRVKGQILLCRRFRLGVSLSRSTVHAQGVFT